MYIVNLLQPSIHTRPWYRLSSLALLTRNAKKKKKKKERNEKK